ncbi:MAG: TonB-dependent receptor [Chitinivibrionales bacterium]|nr:TonB-dependent receptor [Chitinivibrionales bacterium]
MVIRIAELASLFIFCILCICFAQGDDNADLEALDLKSLTEIKINISSTKAKVIFNTPSTVSIITADMIRRYDFKSVNEALTTCAGFGVYPTYHKKDLPSGRGILQNQYSNKVLLLINGVSTWHALTGEANFERIDIGAVERIEVLKGPASVLYGSNAYSGAVNIVLKSSQSKNADILFGAGNGSAVASSGFVGVTKENIAITLGGGVSDESGVTFPWIDKSGMSGIFHPFSKTGNVSAILTVFKNHSVMANVSSSSQAFFGSDPLYLKGAGQSHETRGALLNYSYANNITEKISLKSGATIDWNQVNFMVEPGLPDSVDGMVVPNAEALKMNWTGSRYSGFASANIQFTSVINLEIGGDVDYRLSADSTQTKLYFARKNQLFQTIGLADKSVYEFSQFSQLGLEFKNFGLLIGGRLTKNEFFGLNLSQRLTSNISFNSTNNLKFIYGQSYRSPSFLEVHIFSHDSTRRGNKELQPEKSSSVELAYVTSFSKFFIQALGYYATYNGTIMRSNAIDTNTGTVLYQTFKNGSAFASRGAELELRYDNPTTINCFTNVTFINGTDGDKDASDHYNFKYVPAYWVTGGISKNFGDFYLSTVLFGWARTNSHLKSIRPQYYGNASIGYTHQLSSAKVYHILSVKNILNKMVVFPEYADRDKQGTLNAIPTEAGYGRKIGYTAAFSF